MTTLTEITGIEQKLLASKFKLEPHFRCSPNQSENLVFLSPLVLLEDFDLKQGGYKDNGAKKVLGRITKDILEPDGHFLFQVPEVIYLRMGYGKKSENKKGQMALTEEDANVWMSFLNQSRFVRSRNSVDTSGEEETPMEIDFPTPEDTQALDEPTATEETSLVCPSKSGLKIPLKGRYILLFSILLIFFEKKKKEEKEKEKAESNKEDGKIGANKISDFLLFWILPYLLNFNHQKVREIVQHHKVNSRGSEFDQVVEMSTLDIINDSFEKCPISDEHRCIILDKYKKYYGTEQLKVKYNLLKTEEDTPIILVPKRYKVKDMPATLEDIGQNWRALGDVTQLKEFMSMFVEDKEIQKDFFHSMKELKKRQGIDYAILLPDEETFEEVIGKLEQESADFFGKSEGQKGGRNLITPRTALIKHTDKHLTVCFSFFQGNNSRRVAALFRAIGAAYLDHFTLAILHGLCLNPRDPKCRVGSLYPVSCARKVLFIGKYLHKKGKGKQKIDFSEAQGRFCRVEFPETYESWEEEVKKDKNIDKLIKKTQKTLKINPKFELSGNLSIVFSTTANTKKLKCIAFGAALAQNEEMLERYQSRAVNLNGCLLSMLGKCGRKDNIGVVSAIKDECGEIGSSLPLLPNAIKMIITHFVRAIVIAGLPEVYPAEPDEADRDEIEASSSEEDDEENLDDEPVAASGAAAARQASSGTSGTAEQQRKNIQLGSTCNTRKMHKVTLLCDEWMSSKGGLSTVNRKLSIHLSKLPDVEVSLFMAKCSKKERKLAEKRGIKVFKAQRGSDPERWWTSPPPKLSPDFIIGHGAVLGKAAPDLRKHYKCKWIQVVHTDPEELGNYKEYPGASSAGENKHYKEVKLCRIADLVVGIGPKLTDEFKAFLGHSRKVVCLTPGIFSEFFKVKQAEQEGGKFRVLIFGRGDPEDVSLKGFDIAAKAIASLKDESYMLMVVGANDEYRNKFRERLIGHGISDNQLRVRRFKKRRKELADIFCEADMAIMPSKSEGFGLSALEALSAGLPILVSCNSGLAEAIKVLPNGSSCVVDPEAGADESAVVKEWAKKIKKVREKRRDVRLKHSDLLREQYKKKYIWSKQCKALVKEMLALDPGYSDRGHAEDRPPSSKRRRVYPAEGSSAVRDVEAGTDDEDDSDSNDDDDLDLPSTSGATNQPPAATPCTVPPKLQIKPGKPCVQVLNCLAARIVPEWYKLGIQLGINDDKLKAIRKEEDNPPYEMLCHWMRTKPSEATYGVLYEALCHPPTSRVDLAEEFCCQYIVG